MTRRYLLDSGPAFDYLFRRKDIDARVAELRRKGCKVGICVPILGLNQAKTARAFLENNTKT